LMIVEHDMGVVFELADRISVLVYGEIIVVLSLCVFVCVFSCSVMSDSLQPHGL